MDSATGGGFSTSSAAASRGARASPGSGSVRSGGLREFTSNPSSAMTSKSSRRSSRLPPVLRPNFAISLIIVSICPRWKIGLVTRCECGNFAFISRRRLSETEFLSRALWTFSRSVSCSCPSFMLARASARLYTPKMIRPASRLIVLVSWTTSRSEARG